MSPRNPEGQHSLPSNWFVPEPVYDDTPFARVRAACINCSRRKVRCSGRIPCETCLKSNIKCDGLKSSTRTRWEHRRKKNPTTFPLGVRGLDSNQPGLDDSGSSAAASQYDATDEAQSGLSSPRVPTDSATLPVHSMRLGQNSMRTFPALPLFDVSNVGTASLLAGLDVSQSMPASPFGPPSYSMPDAAAGPANTEFLHQPRPLQGVLGEVASAPVQMIESDPFILAAECLEHQARVLRYMSRRHGSDQSDHPSSAPPSRQGMTNEHIHSHGPGNVANAGNLPDMSLSETQQWLQNWSQSGSM